MTRCGQDGNADSSDGDYVSVAYGLVIKLQAGVGACNDTGTSPCCNFAATADKIVVDVRLEDVRDADAFAAGDFLVLIDVTQRVDEPGDSVTFRDHQVGGVAESVLDKLADSHPHK